MILCGPCCTQRILCGPLWVPEKKHAVIKAELQEMAETIFTQKKPSLAALALLGTGSPSDQDVLYGSIRAVSPEKETIIGLQNKLIYMMNVLQSADVNPTSQAQNGVKDLLDVAVILKVRWNKED